MINYCGEEIKIKNAVLVVNQKGFLNSLYEEIMNADQFTHTYLENHHVAQEIANTLENKTICVNVYYPKWRFSRSHGYFSASEPNSINLNGYKLKDKTIESIVGTLVHELVHVSSFHSLSKFDHGTGRNRNNPKGKANSAPYFSGNTAKSLVKSVRSV